LIKIGLMTLKIVYWVQNVHYQNVDYQNVDYYKMLTATKHQLRNGRLPENVDSYKMSNTSNIK